MSKTEFRRLARYAVLESSPIADAFRTPRDTAADRARTKRAKKRVTRTRAKRVARTRTKRVGRPSALAMLETALLRVEAPVVVAAPVVAAPVVVAAPAQASRQWAYTFAGAGGTVTGRVDAPTEAKARAAIRLTHGLKWVPNGAAVTRVVAA
jgi:hypothetical protein